MLMGALVKSNYFVFNMSTRLAIHTITLKKKEKKSPTPPHPKKDHVFKNAYCSSDEINQFFLPMLYFIDLNFGSTYCSEIQ